MGGADPGTRDRQHALRLGGGPHSRPAPPPRAAGDAAAGGADRTRRGHHLARGRTGALVRGAVMSAGPGAGEELRERLAALHRSLVAGVAAPLQLDGWMDGAALL